MQGTKVHSHSLAAGNTAVITVYTSACQNWNIAAICGQYVGYVHSTNVQWQYAGVHMITF